MQYIAKTGIIAVGFILLAGCATVGEGPEPASETDTSQVIAASQTEESAESELPPVADRDPTDPAVMYGVMAGEMSGSQGDVSAALEAYLEAALISDDPEIAARTTELGMRGRDWQVASMAADRWTVLAPDDPAARAAAVTALLQVSDFFGATRHLDELFRIRESQDGSAWEEAALLLGRGASGEKAKEIMRDLLDRHGDTADAGARLAQSRLALTLGEIQLARDLADEALLIEPERIDLLQYAGRLAIRVEDMEKALEYFRLAWEVDPANDSVTLPYAELLKRSGDYEAAQDLLGSLDQTAEVVFTRVVYALEDEDGELARGLFDDLQDRDFEHTDPKHAFYTAQSAELLEMVLSAVQWYQQVPDGDFWVRARLRLATLMAQLDGIDAGREALAPLKTDNRGDVVEQGFLADSQLLQQAGEIDGAIQSLTMGLSRLQNSDNLRYSRALLYSSQNRPAEAETDLRMIIARNPDHADALNALGYTLTDLTDRHEEALQLIERALQLKPNDAAVIDSMGWVLFRLGEYERAQLFLEQALRLSNNSEIAAHLGEVLWALGEQEQARNLINIARQNNPNDPVLIDTMRRLGIEP